MLRVVEFGSWPRRARTATLLGITSARLRALETLGEIHPRFDFAHRARFDPIEIERLRKKLVAPRERNHGRGGPSGADCAKIFRLFEEGVELRKIVIDLQQPPDVIDRLRRQYAELGRDMVLRAGDVTNLRELLDWHGETPQSLVTAVRERLRYQFERGLRGAAEKTPPKPKTNEVSSGTISGRSEKS